MAGPRRPAVAEAPRQPAEAPRQPAGAPRRPAGAPRRPAAAPAWEGRRAAPAASCARRTGARRRCPSRRRCAASRRAGGGPRPAATVPRPPPPGAASRRATPRRPRTAADPLRQHRLDPGRLVVHALAVQHGRGQPAGRQERGPAAVRADPLRDGLRRRVHDPGVRPAHAVVERAGGPGVETRDGQPEAGVRGEVEAGFRVTRTGPLRREVGQRRVFVPAAVGQLPGGEPVECPPGGRTAQRAEVVQLGEAEAGGVDGADGTVESGRPAAVGRLPGLGPLHQLGRHGGAGAQPGEAGTLHRVPVSHDEADRGVQIDHGGHATCAKAIPPRRIGRGRGGLHARPGPARSVSTPAATDRSA